LLNFSLFFPLLSSSHLSPRDDDDDDEGRGREGARAAREGRELFPLLPLSLTPEFGGGGCVPTVVLPIF